MVIKVNADEMEMRWMDEEDAETPDEDSEDR